VRLKIDENIGRSGVNLLRQAGHDVMTVRDQDLGGSPDDVVYRACVDEQRVLVTLDRDFGQTLRFPPDQSAGIAVLALDRPASRDVLSSRLRSFLALAARRSIRGELWIIEPARVRIHVRSIDE
jgi:predicted nuclease of predicted toxin-antitoxin system